MSRHEGGELLGDALGLVDLDIVARLVEHPDHDLPAMSRAEAFGIAWRDDRVSLGGRDARSDN
jgi:hypothetical protein